MGFYQVEGLSDLIQDFDDLANLPDSVVDEMLDAQADVVVAAQKKTAAAMLQGPYNKGAVAAAVAKGRTYKIADGRALNLNFEGTQHGNRLAEIAFVNEFGKTNQPARPFIWTANEQCAHEATDKARNVYDRYLTSKRL